MENQSMSSSRGGIPHHQQQQHRAMPQSPTRTTTTTLANLRTTSAAPRPLRRSGSSNNGHLADNNGQGTIAASANDAHRYSSHYFPGEESIVLQYPNQWHDDDDADDQDDDEQQLNAAIDPFPRFPPPPNYPPPHKAAAAAAAALSVTSTHRSALCRTIENATSTTGREGVDRSVGVGRGSGSGGGGGDATLKIGSRSSENRKGTNSNGTVTLNRKLGPEHPDAIDTTSCRIMDATNVINSKTLAGCKVSNTAGGRRYTHNTMGRGGGGFQQRSGGGGHQHRHSASIDNDDEDEEEEGEDEEDDNVNFAGENRNGPRGRAAQQRHRQRKAAEEESGASLSSSRTANSNKLFSANGSGSSRTVGRDSSLNDCRQGRTTTTTTTAQKKKNGTRSHNGMTNGTIGASHNNNNSLAPHSNGHAPGHSNQDSQWSRGNIAATMERYEPSTSSSSMSSFASSNHPATTPTCHQDYSYAYYEPGAPMRHSNMQSPVAGPSTAPPPNSIRALLAKGSRNNSFGSPSSSGSSRHACTPRFGTHENIYEEIGSDGRVRLVSSQHHQSMFSLDPASVEEEFRRVQNRHERTLEELNLSVEAMLMPSQEDTAPVIRQPTAQSHVGVDGLEVPLEETDFHLREDEGASGSGNGMGDNESAVGSSSHTNGDLDSGFSGSSSGTSYVGSLRYQRTGSALSNCCPSTMMMMTMSANTRSPNPNELNCRYTSGGGAAAGVASTVAFPSRMSSTYASSRSHNFHTNAAFSDSFQGHSSSSGGKMLPFQRSAEDPGPSRAHIVNLHANHMYSNCVTESGAQVGPGDVKGMFGGGGGGGRLASFWSRKGWRLPGFSSTTCVNKAGITVGPNSVTVAANGGRGGGGSGGSSNDCGGSLAASNALCFGRHPSP